MASVAPPKFKAFTKVKVVLALEPTPPGLGISTGITSLAETPFRDPAGQGPASLLKGPGADEVEALAGPEMFAKKKGKKARGEAKERVKKEAMLPPGILAMTVKKGPTVKPRAPGAKAVYSRMDVMSRDLQASEVGKLSESLKNMAKGLLDIETTNPYQVEPVETFVPMSRRGFGSFLVDQYGPIFPKGLQRELNVATCKGAEGVKEVKIYHYQAFIREYLRFETPYRGLLVYHGLGSGKTCSAIAAAEALFGTRGLKIVVMTPFSLRDNFISEINFCGFKHFRLQNHWTPLSLKPGSNPEPAMVKMFAQSVYGIPDSFFAKRAKGRPQLEKIWIPDFEAESNFDSLSPQDKDEIKTQLKVTIENRIRFINYNGITARELKTMICSTPDIFDNAVIVVDEIHNLTRLMQGSLEPYFSNPPGRRRTLPLEVLTADRKKLPLCGMTKNYMRGYMFYRLFMDAKNAKIIGLSGTPLINFPEELGILSNILHGAIHRIDFTVGITIEGMKDVRPVIEELVSKNENLDTVHFTVSEGSVDVTVTRLPEQFTKVFAEDGDVIGIERRAPGKASPTLEQIWLDLEANMKLQKVKLIGKGSMKAQELLPCWDTPFRGAFLQEDGITLKNVTVLQKRIRGLVSYYRGIQGDVMPKVIKDEIVGIPLTGYSLKIYNKLRNQEIQVEMKKPKQTGSAGDAVWAEINEVATMKSASNYRMSSRQACNFAFPEGITRPRPGNLEELDAETGKDRDAIIDADVEDGVAGKDETEVQAEDDAEAVAEAKAEVAPAGAVAGPVMGTKEAKAAYQAALKAVKDKLRAMGPTHLQLDGPADKNLAKYSPKYAMMLKNINDLPGSSLVYSTFLEMEGIGIFGICMEANGYVPIQIVPGPDGKLKFSDRTITSLAKGPKVPEKRYIEFTGVGSKEQRGAAVDVFNARLDKLTPALQKVLQDAGWKDNFDGGLCRAFCITSAGAEGLSLKCVRGVHIMEPYWNSVRTQQVKGRAVRICSHMDLPKDQQNVSIYTYCSIIPEEALLAQAVDKTLEHSDTYSARDAAALGVPVPKPVDPGAAPVPGAFFKVETGPEEAAAPLPVNDKSGPVRFFSKLDNEYRGFSNFAPAPIVVDGKRYPTVEHFFQSSKFPANLEWQEAIRVSPTPAKAKQLGTEKDGEKRPDWDAQKESIMLTGLRAKFQQNSGLLEQLKGTEPRALIEASTDAYWGEGRTGKGKNRMGKLLEQVRTELKEFVPKPVAVEAGKAAEAAKEEFFEGDDEEVALAEEGEAALPEEVAPALPLAANPNPGADVLGVDEEAQAEATGAPMKGGAGLEDDRSIILTSDQKVLLISLRKEKVLTSLQNIMKSVAVDCEMNLPDNYDGSYKCAALDGNIGDFAYHPDLQKDIQETEARFKKAPAALAATAAPLPAAPLAEGAAEAAVVAPPVAAPVPRAKKVEYRKTWYYYVLKKDEEGNLLGYMFYSIEDPELKTPIGFVKPHPVTGMPKGDVLPVPEGY
jgi:ribA/ribD-fused uncharacterized protein